jgi:hypothetical protein
MGEDYGAGFPARSRKASLTFKPKTFFKEEDNARKNIGSF